MPIGTTDGTDTGRPDIARIVPDCGRVAVSEIDCDDFERDLLPVIRHLVMAKTGGRPGAWHIAYSLAVEKWGERIGFPVAHALARIVGALIDAPIGQRAFSDPLCTEARPWATPHEAAFLMMLHHMRRDNTPQARDCVESLTDGVLDPTLIRVSLTFARRFACGASEPRHARPALKVVV